MKEFMIETENEIKQSKNVLNRGRRLRREGNRDERHEKRKKINDMFC
jgi:hypothetical protein